MADHADRRRLLLSRHGSRYDFAALVFKGVPAPYNLPVPPYRFVKDKTLRIGENPPGNDFEFGSVVQM